MEWDFIPQQGDFEVVDSLGKDLSAILNCPVRYLEAHVAKPMFQCACSKIFPKFAVQAAQNTGEWHDIIIRHKENV
jgi:hypothetical protein